MRLPHYRTPNKRKEAFQDLQRAIRIVRSRADAKSYFPGSPLYAKALKDAGVPIRSSSPARSCAIHRLASGVSPCPWGRPSLSALKLEQPHVQQCHLLNDLLEPTVVLRVRLRLLLPSPPQVEQVRLALDVDGEAGLLIARADYHQAATHHRSQPAQLLA